MEFSSVNGFNPPLPSSAPKLLNEDDHEESNGSNYSKHPAKRFLNLIRLIEKEGSGDLYESSMEELVDLMNSLIQLYSRRGLLQGNVTAAERILSPATQGEKNVDGGSDPQGKGKGKGKGSGKNKHGKKSHLKITTGDEDGSDDLNNPNIPEVLLFTALVRVFNQSEGANEGQDSALILALSAELCLAIIQNVNDRQNDGGSHPCCMAEYEMLAQFGRPILAGLTSRISSLTSEMRKQIATETECTVSSLEKCLSLTKCLHEDQFVVPILSCLRASVALVTLFGTKLSRSTSLLLDLRKISWTLLSAPEESIQEAAARLMAALPLAGGKDRSTPSEIWNSELREILIIINLIIDAVAPVAQESKCDSTSLSKETALVISTWIEFLKQDISTSDDRARTFLGILKGLVCAVQHFLYRDSYSHSTSIFLSARVDINLVLDTIERLLSYSLSAESVYFRTKKRLRNENISGGLVSSHTIATKLSNEVKAQGHDLLDCLVASIGGSTLLPFAKRIIRMGYASLLTSSSIHVRKVLDPTSSAQVGGKQQKWLHLSAPLRTKTVNTLRVILVAFGSDKISSSERRSERKSDGEVATTLVAGALMEQIGAKDIDDNIEENWGDRAEREQLIFACLECLQGVLSSFQGYLGFNTRSTIDSIALTCLLREEQSSAGDIFSNSKIQSGILNLATTCVSTPWNDGATTSIVQLLKRVALKLSLHGDEHLSMRAKEALRVCDLFATPRAPPLVFVHRTIDENSETIEELIPNAIKKIKQVQTETKEARLLMNKANRKKEQEKRKREQVKEESNKRYQENKNKSNENGEQQLPKLKEPALASVSTAASERKEKLEDASSNVKVQKTEHDELAEETKLPAKEPVKENDAADSDLDLEFQDIDIVADGPDSEDED